VEVIAEAINKEVGRKKLVVELSDKLKRFNHYVDALDRDCCNLFAKAD